MDLITPVPMAIQSIAVKSPVFLRGRGADTPAMYTLPYGTRVQDYTLEDALGQGRFSIVYRAAKEGCTTKYAVKVVSKREAGLAAFKGTRKEAVLLQNLDHPYVIHVYDYFELDGSLYVVMDLLLGKDLFAKITELQTYTESFAAHLARNLMVVLEYIHSKSVCHRDVKPENLMLRHQTTDIVDQDTLLSDVVLVDFGTATKFYGFEEKCEASMTDFMGTPEYMAPEVIQTMLKQRVGYNEKCDVWSAGVVIYILLCGWPPFFADTEPLLFDRILRGQHSFPQNTVWDRISPEAKDFVSQCLQVSPENRPSATELLSHWWISEPEPPNVSFKEPPSWVSTSLSLSFSSLDSVDLKTSVRNLRRNIDSIKGKSVAKRPGGGAELGVQAPLGGYAYSAEWEFNKRPVGAGASEEKKPALHFTDDPESPTDTRPLYLRRQTCP